MLFVPVRVTGIVDPATPASESSTADYLGDLLVNHGIVLIERQRKDLQEMRRRGVAMLSITALAATVVGSIGLDQLTQDGVRLFVVGVLALCPSLLLVVRLQLSIGGWHELTPSAILEEWDSWAALSLDQLRFSLAQELAEAEAHNWGIVDRQSLFLYLSFALDALTFGLLLAAVLVSV